MAKLARWYGRLIIPKKLIANYESLGILIEKHQIVSVPLMLTYAFFPVSSNIVYIIAGLSKIRIKLIAASFFIGRLISYSFWVTAAHLVSKSLGSILIRHFSKGSTFIMEAASVGILLLLGSLNWGKILKLDTQFHKK